MFHVDWDRVRTELVGSQLTRSVERTTTTDTDSSDDTRKAFLLSSHAPFKGQGNDRADFDDTSPQEADALLDHIALALANDLDSSS